MHKDLDLTDLKRRVTPYGVQILFGRQLQSSNPYGAGKLKTCPRKQISPNMGNVIKLSLIEIAP